MKRWSSKVLLASLSLCFLFACSISNVFAQSPIQTTVQISSGNNDVNEDGVSFQSTQSPQWLGTSSSTANSYAGYRFTNLTIPKGSTIQTASLQVYSTQSQWLSVSMSISGHAHGNSPAFSASSKPSGRTQTTAKVTSSTNVSWNTNTWYTVSNIATVVQELVNRSDWQSGNAISVLLKGTGNAWGRKFLRAYEGNASQAPKIVVTYLPPPTPTPTPTPTPIPTYSVTGVVFVDSDGSGTQDIGESAYSGGAIIALSDLASASQTTNTFGVYTFSDLFVGNYTLTLTVPTGYVATTQNPKSLILFGNTTQQFGIRPLYTISGTVFEDVNGDGIQDVDELGYSDVPIGLTGTSSQDTQSSGTGSYQFENLISGLYTITLTPPTGYQITTTPHPVMQDLGQNETVALGIQLIPTPTPTPTPEPTPEPTPTPTPVPTPDIADYYVSTTGNDAQVGSITEPFRTIQKAVNTTKTDANLGAAIHVLPGVYREQVTLDGVHGTVESLVSILAENGPDTVFVQGSQPSTDPNITWTQSAEGARFPEFAIPHIYSANVTAWNIIPELAYQTTGTITRLPKAHEPDFGVLEEWKYHENWWKADGAEGITQNTLIDALDDELGSYPEASASAGNLQSINGFTDSFLTGARLFAKDTIDGHDSFTALITAHDASGSGKITLDKNLTYYNGSSGIGPYTKYYIEGAPELLDQPGEWFYDKTTKKLYIWPPDDISPALNTIEFAKRMTIFSIKNSSYVTLKDLTLQFANYGYSGVTGPDGAIRVSGSSEDQVDHVTLDHMRIQHSGIGIRLYQSNAETTSTGSISAFTIKQSAIQDIDGFGLITWHWPVPGPTAFIHHLWIENNEFANLGFRGSGAGLFLQQPEKIVFQNNYLHHTSHNAIDIQQGKGSGNSMILVKNNVSENNCLNGTDCAAFKVWNANPGSGVNNILIMNNIFRGTKGWSYAGAAQNKWNSPLGYGYGGFGYYSDVVNSSTPGTGCAIALFRNIISENSSGGIHYTKSRDQCAFHNVVANNGGGIRMNNYGSITDGSFNNKILRNILLLTEPESNPTNAKLYGISARLNQSDEDELTVDENVYQVSGINAYDMFKQDIGFTNVGTWKTVEQIRENTPWEDNGRDTTTGSFNPGTGPSVDIQTLEELFGVTNVTEPPEVTTIRERLQTEFGLSITDTGTVGRLP